MKPLPFNPFSWIPVGDVYEPTMPMEQEELWNLFIQTIIDFYKNETNKVAVEQV